MNIDYAAIIEKANARKEALQELSELLKDAPKHLDALREAKAWLDEVKAVKLDSEGMLLLPSNVRQSLQNIGRTALYLDYSVLYANDGGHCGLQLLAEGAE
jgi:hypothetical protein